MKLVSKYTQHIEKSKMAEELEEALMAAKEKLESETFVVAFGKDKTKGTYKIRDIWYMESDMHYIIIHTTQGKEKVRKDIGMRKTPEGLRLYSHPCGISGECSIYSIF